MGLLQVVVSAIAAVILGAVWYLPDLPTGQIWRKHANARISSKDNVPMLIAFVCKILVALLLDDYFRSYIAGGNYATVAQNGLWFSVIPSLTFVAHAVYIGHGWPAILVDVSYDAASFALMAIIIVHLY